MVSYTQPIIENVTTPEQLIAYTARVSNQSNQLNHESGPKLLKYLVDQKHWSPLEMVDVTFMIECPRDIGRQLLRHRSFSFQEFSQRYAVADLGWELKDARLQDTKNRQNSVLTEDIGLNAWWEQAQYAVNDKALDLYEEALELGIAKEQARALLPEGLTMSRMYANGNLRSWIFYLKQRLDPTTQKEHRDVANQCRDIIFSEFPTIKELYDSKDD